MQALAVVERLKDTTRHCYTSKGRQESVAEHSWMMTLMAFFMKNEFPDADINKIIQMCIIHDLGECFTGDIPTFRKKLSLNKIYFIFFSDFQKHISCHNFLLQILIFLFFINFLNWKLLL